MGTLTLRGDSNTWYPHFLDHEYKGCYFFLGDWHTAYLLVYGPRKLPKFEKKPETVATPEAAAATTAAPEDKMETS